MDPAKRICLKNLPEGCTKREIAELVRNCTGIQPHSIDLGLNSKGLMRSYSHFSCESTKHVLEVFASGITMRDRVVHAHPAKPHFTYKYAEARRKRERAEEQEEREQKEFWETYKVSALSRFSEGEPIIIKPPKSFYASRQKYAAIAAEIAEQGRTNFHNAHPSSKYGAARVNNQSSSNTNCHNFINNNNNDESAAVTTTTSFIHNFNKENDGNAHAKETNPIFSRNIPREINKIRRGIKDEGVSRKSTKDDIKNLNTVPAVAPTPAPPTKEERKLSSLQARLSSLGAKIYKMGK
ncbi:unnamed protein product [Phytomonas sp. Hart1]|nr:unnamed protein product [Phytomonas sp. Hart1]|eukprot:CCW66924.1 unnamed protein product [Phytomonas sp. isolate Hart1]